MGIRPSKQKTKWTKWKTLRLKFATRKIDFLKKIKLKFGLHWLQVPNFREEHIRIIDGKKAAREYRKEFTNQSGAKQKKAR
ncbi:MAG: hypothetical protein FWE64_03945 [Alphaproteobacteria bacterium]|nr:hypothetical protein [Alphaproteobacteria bacterium]